MNAEDDRRCRDGLRCGGSCTMNYQLCIRTFSSSLSETNRRHARGFNVDGLRGGFLSVLVATNWRNEYGSIVSSRLRCARLDERRAAGGWKRKKEIRSSTLFSQCIPSMFEVFFN